MLNYVSIKVADLERSATFYDAVLSPLGWRRQLEDGASMERLAQRVVAEGLSVRAVEELVSLDEGVAPRPRQKRPRARQLLKHPYFNSIRAEKCAAKLGADALAAPALGAAGAASTADLCAAAPKDLGISCLSPRQSDPGPGIFLRNLSS